MPSFDIIYGIFGMRLGRWEIVTLILCISLGVNGTCIPMLFMANSEVSRLRKVVAEQSSEIAVLRQRVNALMNASVRVGGLYVDFYPNGSSITVRDNGIIYIPCVITVYNLTLINVRPIDLQLEFNITAVGGRRVRYQYLKYYSVRIDNPNITYCQIPYSIYPVYIVNQGRGAKITFYIHVVVRVFYRGQVIVTSGCLGVRRVVVG